MFPGLGLDMDTLPSTRCTSFRYFSEKKLVASLRIVSLALLSLSVVLGFMPYFVRHAVSVLLGRG
jgi:hypothetical protein